MKIYSEKHPSGCTIIKETRVDDGRFIDYMEWQGTLADGSQYNLRGNCDHTGWTYSLILNGEQTAMLNPRCPSGKPRRNRAKPSAM